MMENKPSRLDRLFARTELHRAEREKFEAEAGWHFGFLFGVFLVLTGWGLDAWALMTASADGFWIKLLLEAIVLISTTTLAGGLTGCARGSWLKKTIPWVVLGGATGPVGAYAAFAVTSAVAALLDPGVRGIAIFPFAPAIQERVALLTIFGAVIGFLATLLQHIATGWAWDRTAQDNRLTWDGWRMLMLCAPLAIVLGALYDGAVNSQLRGSLELSHAVIRLALVTPPDADLQKMQTWQLINYGMTVKWRKNFTPRYVQRIADFERKAMASVYLDIQFDKGFIWRCRSTGDSDYLVECRDVRTEYSDWMNQFLRAGDVQCSDCWVQASPSAAAWRSQNERALIEPQIGSVTHHAGGVVTVAAQSQSGSQVECRFVGVEPVVIYDCVKR